MNTEDAQGKAPDPNPDKLSPLPKEIRLTYDTKPINDLTHAINEHKDSKKERKDDSKSAGDRQADAQEHGNTIAGRSLVINSVLAGLTIAALVLSARAVNQASRSADAADSTVSIYRTTLRWDSAKYAKASFDDSVRFQKQFDLSKSIADSQIRIMQGTLAETKRQFKVLNEPFLEMTPPNIEWQDADRTLNISYQLVDLKQFPAQIKKKVSCYVIDSKDDIPNEKCFKDMREQYGVVNKNEIDRAEAINAYVVQGAGIPYRKTFQSGGNISAEVYEGIRDGKCSVHIINEIEYEDLISKNRLRYQGIIRIQVANKNRQIFYEYRYNKNTEITNTKNKGIGE